MGNFSQMMGMEMIHPIKKVHFYNAKKASKYSMMIKKSGEKLALGLGFVLVN